MARVQHLSNWGRWGAEDQVGTLNLLTPEAVLRAVALVSRGRMYSLAVPLGPQGPNLPQRNPTWHLNHLLVSPDHKAADDVLVMHVHGTTHLDGLCHVWYEGKLYNGYDESCVDHNGSTKNSIDKVVGIVGRGVLLDLPRYKKAQSLPIGYVITPEDMEGCARQQNVTIGAGDVLLLRTGWLNLFRKDRTLIYQGEPGPGVAALEWFFDKQIIAVGADNGAVEVIPWEEHGRALYLHQKFIRDFGGYFMELLDLEQLALDRVYEFLFVAAPLRITNGTGSPLNPLAIA